MDDGFVVGGFEPLCNLLEERERFSPAESASGDPRRKRFALNELHHQELRAVVLFESVERGDVGMVERGKQTRFSLEAIETFLVCGEV